MAELMSDTDLSDFVKINGNVDFWHFDEKLMAELMAGPDLSNVM